MDWVKIFSSDDEMKKVLRPGSPRLLVVGSSRICLVLLDNRLHAVEDTCPHNGESLSKGHVNYLGEIVCPWHGQQFSLRTGRECNESSRDLITYDIRQDAEGVFIRI